MLVVGAAGAQGTGLWTEEEALEESLTIPSLRAEKIDQEPIIDGVLDEAVWRRAEKADGFLQQEPDQYDPASEATEVQVAFSETHLFVAVRAYDSEPSEIIARELGRDVRLFRDDSIALLFDTFHDRRNAYFFETNPLGSRTDGYVTDEELFSLEWDGIWRVSSRRTADGWVSEIAIPLKILRFDPASDTWGFQVRRYIRRKNEYSFWSPIGVDASFRRLSKAGVLNGVDGLQPGRDLRIKPYVSASSSRDEDGVTRDDSDLGMDVKWAVGQGLTLDMTVNTDFAETEVDELRVNLSRFSLFFPEKREFFQENAGIFEFGPDLGPALKVFFSRRIGIDEGGRQVPLDFGARLAGREGPWSLGVIGARTGSPAAESQEGLVEASDTDWGVVRLKRNIGRRSNLGLIATEKRAGAGENNRVWGLDGSWKPTDELSLWAFATSSSGPGEASDGWARGAGGSYRGEEWRVRASALDLDDTYDPQVGFVRRKGIRTYYGEVGWMPRPEWSGVRNLSFGVEGETFERQDGETESILASVNLFGLNTDSGHRVQTFLRYRFEELFEPFEIFDQVVLPMGGYHWNEWGVRVGTSQAYPFSADMFFTAGEFYGGDRTNHGLTLRWRPSGHLSFTTTWNNNDVSLPQGDFETNVWRQRVRYAWTADLDANMFLQYNDAAELVAVNLRMGWRYRPGSDLFIVYNQSWGAPELGDLSDRDRRLAVKITYTWGA